MYLLVLFLLPFLTLSHTDPETADNEITGAWEYTYTDEMGTPVKIVAIVADGYFVSTAYSQDDGDFMNTNGGMIEMKDGRLHMTYEFNLAEKNKVGMSESFAASLDGDLLAVEGLEGYWNKIDDGKPGDLYGAWLITGRQRDGEISRTTPGERKTMKILSGTRFQWIAYHTGNAGFFGTGGGTYTTEDGKYTEQIEFFSRDKTRVGASLEFDYDIKDGEWHHSGFSSKGDPLYEIWTRRSDL